LLTETTAIVLRNKKYGETSCIVTMLTHAYGVQTYIVNGVRKSTKKTAGSGMYFQPANVLKMVAYHNETSNLQRIKTYHFHIIFQNIQQHALKNMIALFITEVLYMCLKQPEQNTDLYDFSEDVFMFLDEANTTETANMPLYFLIHLSNVLGFIIQDNYNILNPILNLQDGVFDEQPPNHPQFVQGEVCQIIAQLLKIQHPSELGQLALNQKSRQLTLDVLLQYFSLHITAFGTPKSVRVLKDVLS
jgi:DNA repair protein RecO (recombination protein O)